MDAVCLQFAWVDCRGVPAPPPPPSPGGGGGGGAFVSGLAPVLLEKVAEDVCELEFSCTKLLRSFQTSVHYKDAKKISAFAKSVSKRIQSGVSDEVGKFSPADPLGVVKKIPPERIRERDLRVLRKRIQDLERDLSRVRKDQTREAQEHRETVRRLKGLVETLEETVKSFREHLRIPLRKRSVHRAVRGALEGAELEEVVANEIASAAIRSSARRRRPVPLRKDPTEGIWKLLAGAAVYVVTREAVPDDVAWAKTLGYSAASVFAVVGLSEVLRVEKPEEPVRRAG